MSSQLVDRVLTKDIKMNAKRKLNGNEQFFLVFKYVGLVILTVIAALPIYIMVINSVKGITGVTQSAAFVPPTRLNFAAWGPIWEQMKVPMGRTAFFVVQSSIISAIIGSINGYVFAKWKFKGSNLVFTLFLFGMFIPYQAVMIPLVRLATNMGVNKSIYVYFLISCPSILKYSALTDIQNLLHNI